MSNKQYSMSFTTGGLFHQESVKLAVLYLDRNDWRAVRDTVLSENLLQSRTLATSKRICREIISRLSTLNTTELTSLVHANSKDQAYLLWLAVCRCYSFIADFAVEVIRERYISLNNDLRHEDFDAFLNEKSEWQPELDNLQPATKKKLRQVLFRNLHEAGLLSSQNMIQPVDLQSKALRDVARHAANDLSVFPIMGSDLKELTE